MERRVVITGLGAITPIGNNVEEFWDGIKSGRCGIDKIKNFYISETTKYIESMVGGFMNNMEEKMNICMNDYITSCNYGVVDKMNELKNEILKLDKIYASDDKETIEKNISKYKEYYNFLNNITC